MVQHTDHINNNFRHLILQRVTNLDPSRSCWLRFDMASDTNSQQALLKLARVHLNCRLIRILGASSGILTAYFNPPASLHIKPVQTSKCRPQMRPTLHLRPLPVNSLRKEILYFELRNIPWTFDLAFSATQIQSLVIMCIMIRVWKRHLCRSVRANHQSNQLQPDGLKEASSLHG